jgi:hypothetical protein
MEVNIEMITVREDTTLVGISELRTNFAKVLEVRGSGLFSNDVCTSIICLNDLFRFINGPLVNGNHTILQCSAASGNVISVGSGQIVC